MMVIVHFTHFPAVYNPLKLTQSRILLHNIKDGVSLSHLLWCESQPLATIRKPPLLSRLDVFTVYKYGCGPMDALKGYIQAHRETAHNSVFQSQ